MIHSAFQEVTLASSGDKIIFTGSVTLTGTVNSPLSSGSPKTQFRFGLFEGDSTGPDDNGWVGYSMSNRHGTSSGAGGTLARKPVGNTSAYLSTTGQNSLGTQAGDNTNASLFNDDTYFMNLTIQRSGNDLVISATLDGLNGFTQSISATDATALTQGTYSFNRLGFLLGMNLGGRSSDVFQFADHVHTRRSAWRLQQRRQRRRGRLCCVAKAGAVGRAVSGMASKFWQYVQPCHRSKQRRYSGACIRNSDGICNFDIRLAAK